MAMERGAGMAYVKVGSSRSASATLTYGEYKDGVKREGVIISSVNCDAGLAKTEFKAVREAWGKVDGVQKINRPIYRISLILMILPRFCCSSRP